jgi:hypothetical protein
MKVGRVAIITRGRYAGKKVRPEIIPFQFLREEDFMQWFWTRGA